MIYAVTILGGDERFLGTHIEGYERLKQQECSQEQPKGVEEKEARLERTSKEEKGDENKQTNKQKEARINRLTHQALRVNRKKKKEGEEEREKERERETEERTLAPTRGLTLKGEKGWNRCQVLYLLCQALSAEMVALSFPREDYREREASAKRSSFSHPAPEPWWPFSQIALMPGRTQRALNGIAHRTHSRLRFRDGTVRLHPAAQLRH